MTVKGGNKLKRILKDARRGGIAKVDVGFFATAKYPDGTRVTTVAAKNEFGGDGVPERPFMRQAAIKMRPEILAILERHLDSKKMAVSPTLGGLVGQRAGDVIKQRINDFDTPANSAETVARKGANNPLVDTATMKRSVTYKIIT